MIHSIAQDRPTDPHGARLFRLVEELQVKFGYERSVRFCQREIFPERFLLSLNKASLAPDADSKLGELFRLLGMPESLVEKSHEFSHSAKFIHLGFEKTSLACMSKIYFEIGLPTTICNQKPIILHRALKWDVAQPDRSVATQYVWHPRLESELLFKKLDEVYCSHDEHEPLEIARRILREVLKRVDPTSVRYMEVIEDQNPRRSFDLNLYQSRLCVSDLQPLLLRMQLHYQIPDQPFQDWYEQAQWTSLGHLAGGVHRDGHDFMNLYFGVEER